MFRNYCHFYGKSSHDSDVRLLWAFAEIASVLPVLRLSLLFVWVKICCGVAELPSCRKSVKCTKH